MVFHAFFFLQMLVGEMLLKRFSPLGMMQTDPPSAWPLKHVHKSYFVRLKEGKKKKVGLSMFFLSCGFTVPRGFFQSTLDLPTGAFILLSFGYT